MNHLQMKRFLIALPIALVVVGLIVLSFPEVRFALIYHGIENGMTMDEVQEVMERYLLSPSKCESGNSNCPLIKDFGNDASIYLHPYSIGGSDAIHLSLQEGKVIEKRFSPD